MSYHTMFENCPKSRIQPCERSELHLHFECTKVNQKCQKIVYFDEFLKAVLLDMSILIGQRWVKNAKIEN